MRCQGRALREDAGIAFLATERTAHTTANDLHICRGQVQRRSGLPLVAVWVLGRHVQRELPVFTWDRIADMALKIKLLLLTTLGHPLQTARRRGHHARGISACDAFGGHDKLLCRHRIIDSQDGRELLDRDLRVKRGLTRIQHVTRHHHRYRLANELNGTFSQERVVMNDRAAVVFARNIFRSKHRNHPVHRQNRLAIHTLAD